MENNTDNPTPTSEAPLPTQVEVSNNKKLLLFLVMGPVLVMVLLVGAIVWGIKTKPPGTDTRTSIQIFADNNFPGLSVLEQGDNYIVKYQADNFEESFEINKSAKDKSSLGGHLLQLVTSNSRNEYSPFYSTSNQNASNSYRRIVDITLDVSGSVKGLANQDPAYYDKVSDKIKNILVQENLKPGDRIRVRFLGAHPNSNQVYTIDFTGPRFLYDIDYQRAFDRGLITLKGYSLEKPTTQDPLVNATASSVKELFDAVRSKHQEVVQGPAGPGTFLIAHLNTIANDNDVYAENRFGSVIYILLTDGEFNIEPSVANKIGVEYCFIETYSSCHPRIIDALDKGEILSADRTGGSSKSLSIDPLVDKVFMVGLNRSGDPLYGQSLESFFKGIFKPITTIKFLD